MPENQTAWNSDNHGIKETNRTTRPVRQQMERNRGKVADLMGRAGCGEVAGFEGRLT